MKNRGERRAKGENPRNFVGFVVKDDDDYKTLVDRAAAAGVGRYTYAGGIFNALWHQIAQMDIGLEKARALRVIDPSHAVIDNTESWVITVLRTLRASNPGLMARAVLSLAVFAEDGGIEMPEAIRNDLTEISESSEKAGDRGEEDRGAIRQTGRRKAPSPR